MGLGVFQSYDYDPSDFSFTFNGNLSCLSNIFFCFYFRELQLTYSALNSVCVLMSGVTSEGEVFVTAATPVEEAPPDLDATIKALKGDGELILGLLLLRSEIPLNALFPSQFPFLPLLNNLHSKVPTFVCLSVKKALINNFSFFPTECAQ